MTTRNAQEEPMSTTYSVVKNLCLDFLRSGDSPGDMKQRERAASLLADFFEAPYSSVDGEERARFFSVCDGFDDALTEFKETTPGYPDLDREDEDRLKRRLNELAPLVADHDSGGWNSRAILDRFGGALSEENVDALHESLAGERGVPVSRENFEKTMICISMMTNPPSSLVTEERLSVLARGIVRSPTSLSVGHAVVSASNVSWKLLRERGIGRMIASAFASLPEEERRERISLYTDEFRTFAKDTNTTEFTDSLCGVLFAACCSMQGEIDERVAQAMCLADKLSPSSSCDAMFRIIRSEMFSDGFSWLGYASLLGAEELKSNLNDKRKKSGSLVAELLVLDAEDGMSDEKCAVHERLLRKCGEEIFESEGEAAGRYSAAAAAGLGDGGDAGPVL